MANPTVGIRLDKETQERLKILGKRRDRSPHYLMKQAIEGFLDHEEQEEAELLEMQRRWRKYELTGESYTHDEVGVWIKELIASKTKK